MPFMVILLLVVNVCALLSSFPTHASCGRVCFSVPSLEGIGSSTARYEHWYSDQLGSVELANRGANGLLVCLFVRSLVGRGRGQSCTMVGKKTDDRIQHDFSLPQLECQYVYSIIVETLGQQFLYFLRNGNVCYERKMFTKIDR